MDTAFMNANKAYVSRLQNTSRLLILNPTTLAILGELELGLLIKPNDPDGSPEPAYMLVNNGLLYVILRHLGNFVPVARGEIVVIDPVTEHRDSHSVTVHESTLAAAFQSHTQTYPGELRRQFRSQ